MNSHHSATDGRRRTGSCVAAQLHHRVGQLSVVDVVPLSTSEPNDHLRSSRVPPQDPSLWAEPTRPTLGQSLQLREADSWRIGFSGLGIGRRWVSTALLAETYPHSYLRLPSELKGVTRSIAEVWSSVCIRVAAHDRLSRRRGQRTCCLRRVDRPTVANSALSYSPDPQARRSEYHPSRPRSIDVTQDRARMRLRDRGRAGTDSARHSGIGYILSASSCEVLWRVARVGKNGPEVRSGVGQESAGVAAQHELGRSRR